MSISIPHLAIEVTRKCNINCNHCLRGNSQNKDISLEYIDILLDQINSIGHFCPTGGEPSLNVPSIKYFIDGCKKRNISINTFYIATNGVDLTIDFINVCKELYELCQNKKQSSLQISNDFYHVSERMYNDNLLKDLPFYTKRHNDGDFLVEKLHREGKLANNENAKVMSGAIPVTSIEIFNKNPIYLNVNGDIINGCDWSYSNQKFHFLCKVYSIEDFKINLEKNEKNLENNRVQF